MQQVHDGVNDDDDDINAYFLIGLLPTCCFGVFEDVLLVNHQKNKECVCV